MTLIYLNIIMDIYKILYNNNNNLFLKIFRKLKSTAIYIKNQLNRKEDNFLQFYFIFNHLYIILHFFI